MVEKPFDVLKNSIGKQVLIRLKGGGEFRGILKSFDTHMNLVLESAEELKNNESEKKLGLLVVRGDNILFVSPEL